MTDIEELLPISINKIGEEEVNAIDARTLHEFLENKEMFSTWIKERIAKYDFTENVDYVSFLVNSKKGRPRTEYHISLDMAKELSMVERNDKGKQARKYFIECEKKLVEVLSPKTRCLVAILEAGDDVSKALALRDYDISYVQPLEKIADIYQTLVESKNTFSMAHTAQILNIEKMGRNKLMSKLREAKILKHDNTPYQSYINRGWFDVHIANTVNGPKATSRTTVRGVEGILKLSEGWGH